jgi:putative hydrolase of the HAD superfamily
MAARFDLIAFDGDDTLWHNERSYRDAREHFRALLNRVGIDLDVEQVETTITRTEVANIRYFGYGVSSFTLSLIETAVELTEGRVTSEELRELVQLAKGMMSEGIDVFDGVRDTLTTLSSRGPLMLITKGDLLHQASKLERSGLQDLFHHVEIVSDKNPAVYQRILDRHGIDPVRVLMVGNSLRSDILPVIELGGVAALIPAALNWSLEQADPPDDAHGRYFELSSITQVVELVNRLEAAASSGVGGLRDSLGDLRDSLGK